MRTRNVVFLVFWGMLPDRSEHVLLAQVTMLFDRKAKRLDMIRAFRERRKQLQHIEASE